ncbi:MAG: hypothetical protein PVF05_02675 [Gemmatimonadales bacterium]
MSGVGGILALLALLAGTAAGPGAGVREPPRPTGAAADVASDTVIRSERWPPAAVVVDPGFRHLGSRTISLGRATAEIHVLADVAEGRVRRFYWIQFEGRPSGRYDYSALPYCDTIGDYVFDVDVRHGAYTEAEVRDEPDTHAVGEILAAAGYDFPAPMMRARMATVDGSGRNELLVIYMEALSAGGLDESALAGKDAWAAASMQLRTRAVAGLELRPD